MAPACAGVAECSAACGLLSDPEAGRVAQVIVVALHKAGCEADSDEGGEAGKKNDHDGNP